MQTARALHLGMLNIGLIVCVCLIIFIALHVVSVMMKASARRRLEESIEAEYPIGKEAVFTGHYLSHWEVARFDWYKDGVAWRGWNIDLMCELVIPDPDGWKWLTDVVGENPGFDSSAEFEMTFRGKIIEKGRFGHKGICRYRVEVWEMLSVQEVRSAADMKRLARSLLDAVLSDDTESVRLLIGRGADVNAAKDEEHDITALMYAVESGGIEIVRLLLKAGAAVNAWDWMGRTAFMYAVDASRADVVELLKMYGAKEEPPEAW